MNGNMEVLLRRLRLKRVAKWMYEDRSVFSYIIDSYGRYFLGEDVCYNHQPSREEVVAAVLPESSFDDVAGLSPTEEIVRHRFIEPEKGTHSFNRPVACHISEEEDEGERRMTPAEIVRCVRMLHRRNRGDAEAVLYDALRGLPMADVVTAFVSLLKRVNPQVQEEIIDRMFNQARLPQKGAVDVAVVKREKEQTDHVQYDYYICFKHQETGISRPVFFSNHASASIYLMHLIDRVVRKDDSRRIDVMKNKNLLGRVHRQLFPLDEKIMGMTLSEVLKGDNQLSVEKNRLSQFYIDIRDKVDSQIKGWDYGFLYYPDEEFGLRLSPENIWLPKEFCFDDWRILG